MMNVLIIILIVVILVVGILQIVQLKTMSQLWREIELLRQELNAQDGAHDAVIEPTQPTETMTTQVAEPAPMVVEAQCDKTKSTADEPASEAKVEAKTEDKAVVTVAPEPAKKERKTVGSEDILFWTILGVIAALSIFFAIAL